MALAVESRAEDLEEAVYYDMTELEMRCLAKRLPSCRIVPDVECRDGFCREGSGEDGVAETMW